MPSPQHYAPAYSPLIDHVGVCAAQKAQLVFWERPKMAKLKFIPGKQYFSTLTSRYYPDYDAAFHDSLRESSGAYVDFNIYYIESDGKFEYVF